ncbi:MAG: transcriptional regulator [Elusimicrobia bacterium HGW-Elusimicrobia-1]|jgi:ArsR family transcriptional regulator|nr:MAG: transcriptional regulator [Elusimicrobia bacterium HGW-Elusimicrobia-1]
MKNLLKIFKALGDPARLKIIKILETRSMCVCEITAALDSPQPNVSHHLRILKEAGLIVDVKNGKWVEYELADYAPSPELRRIIDSASKMLKNDKAVAAAIKKSRCADRKKLCR